MNRKKDIRHFLFLSCLVLMTGVMVIIKKKPANAAYIVSEDSGRDLLKSVPFVLVNKDSLRQLVSHFAGQNNAGFNVENISAKAVRVHIDRIGPSASPFYCGNTKLPALSGQGFELNISKDNEIDAVFEIQQSFVKIPSDILCGLMKQHPNIR